MPMLNNLAPVLGTLRLIGAVALAMVAIPCTAGALECPSPKPATTPTAIKEPKQLIENYSDLLRAQGDKAITKIVSSVRTKHPGASDAEITNFVVTIYCPVLQKNSALSEPEKRARLKRVSTKLLSKLAH